MNFVNINKYDFSKHIFSYDIIRIFAILAVIMTHCSAMVVLKFLPSAIENSSFIDAQSLSFAIGNIFDSISRMAVPCFLMLSGALMLNEDKEIPAVKITKKIAKLFVLLLFWSALYAMCYHPKAFIHYLFYGHYHLWYLYLIIGLYLITPILRLFVKRENIKYIYYFLILSIVFQFLPQILDFAFHNTKYISKYTNIFHLEYVSGYTAYYLAGWLLTQDYKRILKYKNLILLILLFSVTAMFILTQIYTTRQFKAYKLFYENTLILNFMYGTSCFFFIKYLVEKIENKVPDYIKYFCMILGKLSLGVYLIHVSILYGIKALLKSYSNTLISDHTALYIILCFILTSFCSFIITYILYKIKYVREIVKI